MLTTPVVRCLKQQVQDAEVHYVTKHRYADLLSSNPYIDKLHLLTGSMNDLIARLKEEQFDFIIDLHNNFRSKQIRLRLGIPSAVFNKLNIEKYLLVNFKIDRMPPVHVVDRYMKTLEQFEVRNDGKGLDFFIPERKAFNRNELPPAFRNGFIAFVLAGTWNTKKLPASKVKEVCNRISYPVILLGGNEEYQAGEEISRLFPDRILNMAGKLSLLQSGSLVRDARLVLTNDTGLMHIAAAYQKKILSFWGNTVPSFGMTPYGASADSLQMEVHGLECRPCSKIGYKACPKRHFRCMLQQDVDEAVKWVSREFEAAG